MPYFWGDFPFDSSAFFMLSTSSIDSIQSKEQKKIIIDNTDNRNAMTHENIVRAISVENICYYTPGFDDFLHNLSIQYNQNILVEKFISGYEVDVPLIRTDKETIAFDPIGITINGNFNITDNILDYNTRVNDNYLYKPFEILNESLPKRLKVSAEKAANIMGLSGVACPMW